MTEGRPDPTPRRFSWPWRHAAGGERRARPGRFRVTTLGLMGFVAYVALFVAYPFSQMRPASQSEAIASAIRWTVASGTGNAREGSEIHAARGKGEKIWWVTIVDRPRGRQTVVSVWSPSNLSGWDSTAENPVSFPGEQFRLDRLDPPRWSKADGADAR